MKFTSGLHELAAGNEVPTKFPYISKMAAVSLVIQ